MALHREFKNPENDPGVWHVYPEKDPETGKVIRFKLRAIPRAVEEKIKAAHKVNKMTMRQAGRQASETDINLEKERDVIRDRAAFAIRESENYEIFVGDEDAAKEYSEILGQTIPVGALLLDGHWDNPRLKGHIMYEHADLATWAVQVIDGLVRDDDKRNEELRGN